MQINFKISIKDYLETLWIFYILILNIYLNVESYIKLFAYENRVAVDINAYYFELALYIMPSQME